MGSAEVADGNASLVGVEDPVGGALETDVVVPVPGGAADLSRSGVVGLREDASAVAEVVTLVAGGAGSAAVGGLAEVAHGHAHFVAVEGPVGGASKTNLIFPIPSGAT